jgi:Mn2+/Fe2+ NRAMP family transporter
LGGQIGSYVFALGFIGSGMLAIPVLAGADSAAMAGLIGKGAGVSNSLREAPVFYGLCAIGTVGGMAVSLASVNPIKLLVLVAVINGVTAGPFLIVVMRVSPDRAIMGESINGALAGWLDWHRRHRGFLRERRPLGMKCARVGERDGSTRSARRSG